MPSVFFDVVYFTCFYLDLFDVIVTTKCVDRGSLHAHSREETDFTWHRRSMMNVFIDILKTVVPHAAEEEPRPNVFVLLFRNGLHALGPSIYEYSGKVAGKLTFVLSN